MPFRQSFFFIDVYMYFITYGGKSNFIGTGIGRGKSLTINTSVKQTANVGS